MTLQPSPSPADARRSGFRRQRLNPRWWALLAIPLSVVLGAATPAWSQEKAAATTSTPEQLVDALNAVFGAHPGARAVHAKGIILEGTFTPAATAKTLSKADHLQSSSVPVTVRFSNFAGIPTLPDTHPLASPHGLAIKFHLADGSETDIVAHSFNGFPSATTDEFRELLLALAASGPTAAKPTALDGFLGTHPAAKAFLETPKPPPVSYATLAYFGVNAFKFTNAAGDAAFGRYQFEPVAGTHALTDEQAKAAAPNYLADEIRERLKRGPVEFRLLVQVAGPGDKIEDPSTPWPDTRKKVELGTIAITKVSELNGANDAKDSVLFLPGALVPGIEAADPMIEARTTSYAVSFGRRQE